MVGGPSQSARDLERARGVFDEVSAYPSIELGPRQRGTWLIAMFGLGPLPARVVLDSDHGLVRAQVLLPALRLIELSRVTDQIPYPRPELTQDPEPGSPVLLEYSHRLETLTAEEATGLLAACALYTVALLERALPEMGPLHQEFYRGNGYWPMVGLGADPRNLLASAPLPYARWRDLSPLVDGDWERLDEGVLQTARWLSVVRELDDVSLRRHEEGTDLELPDGTRLAWDGYNNIRTLVAADDVRHLVGYWDLDDDNESESAYHRDSKLKRGLVLMEEITEGPGTMQEIYVCMDETPLDRIPVIIALSVRAHRVLTNQSLGVIGLAEEAVEISDHTGWAISEQVRDAAAADRTARTERPPLAESSSQGSGEVTQSAINRFLDATPQAAPDGDWARLAYGLEHVLVAFGEQFTIEVGPYYVQGRREGENVTLEAVSNSFLRGVSVLGADQVSRMLEVGWEAPGDDSPNFSWWLPGHAWDIPATAKMIVETFRDAYRAGLDDDWSVLPPALHPGVEQRMAEWRSSEPVTAPSVPPAAVADSPAAVQVPEVSRTRARKMPAKKSAVKKAAVKRAPARASRLTEGLDEAAQRARLADPAVSLEFLRASRHTLSAIGAGEVELDVALRLLESDLSPRLIDALARRPDAPRDVLIAAAKTGYRTATTRAERGRYLACSVMPIDAVSRVLDGYEAAIGNALAHPEVTEDRVLRHVLSTNARLRYLALSAAERNDLALPPTILNIARLLPVDENTTGHIFTQTKIERLADRLLARAGAR